MTKDSFRIGSDSTGKEFIELTHIEFNKNPRGEDDIEIYPHCYRGQTIIPDVPCCIFKKIFD